MISRNLGAKETGKLPKGKHSEKKKTSLKYQGWIKKYLATTLSLDESVGTLLQYLKEAGLADNTVIVYTSDQGLFIGEHGWYDKRFMYEEAMRTPLIIRYPKMIKPGSVNNDMVINIDYAPTFLELANASIPDDIQGRSMVPLLKGKTPADWQKAVYYRYYDFPDAHNVERHYGIRTDQYKLIHFYYSMDEWELFDLKKDPHELNNLFNNPEYLGIVKSLKKKLYKLQAFYKDKPYHAVGRGSRIRKESIREKPYNR